MGSLASLPNIGKVLEQNLNSIGIHTPQELQAVGSKDAFLRIRRIDSGACLHMLYGLQGAIEGVRYTQLSEKTKQDLKDFFNSL